jgi:hypothetical protein
LGKCIEIGCHQDDGGEKRQQTHYSRSHNNFDNIDAGHIYEHIETCCVGGEKFEILSLYDYLIGFFPSHAKSEIDVMLDVVNSLLKKEGNLTQQIITKPKISHAKHLKDLCLNNLLKQRVRARFRCGDLWRVCM